MPRVTAHHVAEKTGYSLPAVYQALRGDGKLSPQTRKRILATAREMGYRRNAAARATRAGRFNTVSLLLSSVGARSYLPARLLHGIRLGAQEHDQRLVLAEFSDEKLTSAGFMPRLLSEWSSDGLLVDYHTQVPQGFKALVGELAIPSVWINLKQTHDAIYPDDFGAAALATRHLLDAGHRRIGYLRLSTDDHDRHHSLSDRLAGYRSVMHDAGLAEMVFEPRESAERARYQAITQRWLGGADRPTAVVAYSEAEGLAVLTAALSRGLRVPADLSLITIADGPLDDAGLRITTAKIDMREVGRQAVGLLLRKIAAPDRRLPAIVIDSVLRDGATVAPRLKR